MNETTVTHGPFRITARVPDDVIGLDPAADPEADGDWAAWVGFASPLAGDRRAVLLIAIAVTAFDPPPAVAPGEMFAAMLRSRRQDIARVEELTTAAGHPAVSLRMTATANVRGNAIGTGQAQALVVYPEAGALGVVSGVCFDADDLDVTAALVAGIAAQMSVEVAAAAA